MTRVLTFLLICCIALPAWSAEDERTTSTFEREMFSASVITPSGISSSRLEALSPKQRQDLLTARQTLMTFFKVSQSHSPEVRGLVHPGLLGRFPDQMMLLSKLFGQETEVCIGAVTDFEISSANEIQLGYYVILFVEGSFILREDKTLLRHSEGKWLIARIGGV
jgi:hypothetical protein